MLKRIKNDDHTRRIPVIMLTTAEDEREIERCYALGCNLYVTKPMDYESFCSAVQELGLFHPQCQISRVHRDARCVTPKTKPPPVKFPAAACYCHTRLNKLSGGDDDRDGHEPDDRGVHHDDGTTNDDDGSGNDDGSANGDANDASAPFTEPLQVAGVPHGPIASPPAGAEQPVLLGQETNTVLASA